MATCNRCTLRWFQDRAKASGEIVEVRPCKRHGEGVDVFVRHLKDEPDYRSPDDGNKQWRAWFMELPASCTC